MTTPLAAKIAPEYGTPCAVIDMDRVERNIARIQAACDAAGVANRPHIKTHKSPMLAQMQVTAGARGITCQKIGEAEVMADAGIDDILITYNLLGEEKMARLGALQTKANMTVAADNSVVVAGLLKGTIRCGARFEVLPTGRVTGDVQSPTLVVHEGAVVTGQFRMGVGEPATSEAKPAPTPTSATRYGILNSQPSGHATHAAGMPWIATQPSKRDVRHSRTPSHSAASANAATSQRR